MIEFLDLRPHHAPLAGALLERAAQVLRGGQYVLGRYVEEFEAQIADFLGVPFAVGVSSGTDALQVALSALGIGPGDEVITTPYSFISTASVIARLGARVRFVDIEPDSFLLDPRALEETLVGMNAKARARIKAIVPVHLFGRCAQVEALQSAIARSCDHSIPIIEDAAQAIGARQTPGGPAAGTLGEMGCFSFFPTKNLGALGEAGLITCHTEARRAQLRSLRAHGELEKGVFGALSGNHRMDAMQAALLSVKLPHLPTWIETRQRNASYYTEKLGGLGELRCPETPFQGAHVFHQYVLRTSARDALAEHLRTRGIGTAIYYPTPLHQQPCLVDHHAHEAHPNAEAAARESLALPIYPGLRREDQDEIIRVIEEFLS